ncbi:MULTISPECIES: glycosyltransferase family 4 protein [unclassified Frigoribacterium]|uniref:glycosyltransferase family 4 protein n=1 Tax=unclassified Frigoribacterium TaxID=2627005 RepID=UPI001563D342|nr:glycosyltransferase family 4 protein [Frigoribacterium sp. VKM Ac-2860]NQX09242.1 glycosyltransferase family 4 protein [Frigoribacterium sp. VKM Ac-2859]
MIEVLFASERDVPGWAADHAAGLRPGLWPYGLEALRDADPGARIASVPEPGRLQVLRDRVVPRRASSSGVPSDDVGVTWDENVARRMLLARPHERMYTGVIWVTDRVERGQDVGRMRDVLRRMSGLWVISRGQVEPLRRFVGEDGPPVGFFTFGVDEDFFAARPWPTRPMVLSIGGDRDRDPATLFATLEQVHAERPDVELVVQTTSDAAPPEGVTVVPHVSHRELAELYARASLVAVATRDNLHASGMTVSLEAMATGRPVVMTDTPGIEDYVVHERTGLLAPVGDSAALAGNVLRLLGDEAEARAFGAAGRALVEERLTTRHLAASLAEFVGASA